MKRHLAAVFVALTAVAIVYGYAVSRQDQAYRHHLERGDEALARDDTFSAIEAFSAAIAVKGDAMAGYLKRGETYRRRDELETAIRGPVQPGAFTPRPSLDAALRDLRRASELDPLAPRPFELLGDVNYSLGRFDRAIDGYQRCVALDDQSPRVLYKMALSHYTAGRPQVALDALSKALALDDRFAEAHYLSGLCARDLQRPEAALTALTRSVELAPALLQAREELAHLYGRQGRPADRIAMLEALRALDASPSRDVALGLAYAQAGRTAAAVRALGRAVDAYPAHGYTYVALGRVWLEIAQSRGDRVALSKALGALEGVLVGTETSSEALTLFGRALLLAGDEELAERMLTQASEQLPADPLAFYHLAEAAARSGHFESARGALLDYEALAGYDMSERDRAALWTRVADYSTRLDDHAAAVAWYQRVVDAGASDAPLLVKLGEAQLRAGDRPAARQTASRALDRDPSNRPARLLLRRAGGQAP